MIQWHPLSDIAPEITIDPHPEAQFPAMVAAAFRPYGRRVAPAHAHP